MKGGWPRARAARVLVAAVALAGTVLSPAPLAGQEEASTEAPSQGGSRPRGEAVAEHNLGEFSVALEQTLAAALAAVLESLPSPTTHDGGGRLFARPALARPGLGTLEPITGLEVAGVTGGLRVKGSRVLGPNPPRYEVALEFDGYSPGGSFVVNGNLDYSLVVDDGAVHGLFRGQLDLFERFGGATDVRGHVAGGQIASLSVASEDGQFLVGDREPPPFLIYVSTVAGTGRPGYADGPAGQAQFNEPRGIVVDDEGRIFVADGRNKAVREIGTDGIVRTLAKDFTEPRDLGIDGHGHVVVSDRNAKVPLARVIPEGPSRGKVIPVVPERGAGLGIPVVGSRFGGRVECSVWGTCDGWPRQAGIRYAGGIDVRGGTTFLAQWSLPAALRMVLPDGFTMTVRVGGDSGECSSVGAIGAPNDVARGNRGELFFSTCNAIRVLQPDGQIVTLAGNLRENGKQDGRAEEARFFGPEGIAFDDERYLYVVDGSNNLLRRVDVQTGEVVRLAGCASSSCGPLELRLRDGLGDSVVFDGLAGVAIDRWGDLYVTEDRNHTVRQVRIIVDPARKPSVQRFDPFVLQRGQETTVEILGRNLSLVEQVDFGPGIRATVERAGYRRVQVRVALTPDAPVGARPISLSTPFGSVTTSSGLSLRVMEPSTGEQVTTIAGTGDWAPGVTDGPADKAKFAFPLGLYAQNGGKLLVADPVEQRIRLVATRDEAAKEILDIMLEESGTTGQVASGVLSALGGLGSALSGLGIGNALGKPEAEILRVIKQGLDQMCREAGSDCAWIALPWAGVPMAPGSSGGFRLGAKFLFPTDISGEGTGNALIQLAPREEKVFFVADAGNNRVRTVGIDPSRNPPPKKEYYVFATNSYPSAPLTVAGRGETRVYASMPSAATVSSATLGSGAQHEWAGVQGYSQCAKGPGDVKHPLGVPLGAAASGEYLYVADPFCGTIWRIRDRGGQAEVADMRTSLWGYSAGFGNCTDGPIGFATFGAPMDVAVDKRGNLWVADTDCHSVRLIYQKFGASNDADEIARDLAGWLETANERIGSERMEELRRRLAAADTELLDANRWWVTTVAGSSDGKAGYSDGPARQALFNAPTSVAVAESGGKTRVFISDTGNKRIRLLTVP